MRLMWDTHTTAHGIHSSDPAPYLSGRAFTVFFVCSREDRQNPGPPAACPCLLVRPSRLQPCIVVDGTRMVSSARLKSFVTERTDDGDEDTDGRGQAATPVAVRPRRGDAGRGQATYSKCDLRARARARARAARRGKFHGGNVRGAARAFRRAFGARTPISALCDEIYLVNSLVGCFEQNATLSTPASAGNFSS